MRRTILFQLKNKPKHYLMLILASILTVIIISVFLDITAYAQQTFKLLNNESPFLTFIITPITFVIIIYIAKYHCNFVQSSGIPQVIAAMDSRNKNIRKQLLSFRIVIDKIFFIFLAMLTGAPIGVGGASTHIGSSIFFGFNHYLNLKSKLQIHSLMSIGGSAGLIVAFNAPIAGFMFAYEELGRNKSFKKQFLILIAIASLVTYALAVLYRGNNPYLGNYSFLNFNLLNIWQLLPMVIIAGLLGGVFSKVTIFLINKLNFYKTKKVIITAFILGFIIAILNYYSQGKIAGSGYHETMQLLDKNSLGHEFFIMKYFATITSLISTIPGGLFTPSVSIGASLGSELSYFYNLSPQVIIIFTIVSYLSAVIRAPLTASFAILEMTATLHLIIPALIIAFISNYISSLVQKETLYQALAKSYLKFSMH